MSLVLIAGSPEEIVSLTSILHGHELTTAITMSVAVTNLQEQMFDLIIVGVHFDDSRMFEFVREIKKSPKSVNKPIICFCARETEMTRLMHESLTITTRVLGSWMYLDEHAYNVFRDPADELRRVIERCLTGEARREIQQQRVGIQRQRTVLQDLRLMLDAQSWSPEMKVYLEELKHDRDCLLDELTKLQLAAVTQRSIIETSRDVQDRVSEQVTKAEDGMTQIEQLQAVDETEQSTREEGLAQKEIQ